MCGKHNIVDLMTRKSCHQPFVWSVGGVQAGILVHKLLVPATALWSDANPPPVKPPLMFVSNQGLANKTIQLYLRPGDYGQKALRRSWCIPYVVTHFCSTQVGEHNILLCRW